MNNCMLYELNKRKTELESAIYTAETWFASAPEGKVRSSRGGTGYTEFYHVTDESGSKGRFIRRENHELAMALIQKEYTAHFLTSAKRELLHINSLIKAATCSRPEKAIEKLNENKRKLARPYLQDDATFLGKWLQTPYVTNSFFAEEKKYPTKNGELVRSKSEAMIADAYYELGIPYKYECELRLKDGKRKYPDFTVLDVKSRRIVYHEHMGRLDKEDYRTGNLSKISDYMRNGIYTGKNLLLTFESDECSLNIMDFKEMVKELFL